MLPHETAEDAFVVEIDRDAVARERDRLRRVMMRHVRGAFGGAILVVISIFVGSIWVSSLDIPVDVWLLWLWLPVAGFMIYDGVHTLGQVNKQLKAWDNAPAVTVGLRLTPSGLEYRTDETPDPVFLPWATVAGLLVVRRAGHDYLFVDLAPGVHGGTAGVRGFNQPHVQRQLRDPRILGEKGLRHPMSTLRQPVEAIAAAAASFSQGRVRLVRS